jgi:hypothetical protein
MVAPLNFLPQARRPRPKKRWHARSMKGLQVPLPHLAALAHTSWLLPTPHGAVAWRALVVFADTPSLLPTTDSHLVLIALR